MNTKGPYIIEGFVTPNADIGSDYDVERDTLADAKKHARYLLTDDFRRVIEASGKLAYVRILDANRDCVFDVFRTVDREVSYAAAKLAGLSYNGLYSSDGRRFNNARPVLGYPNDFIELRNVNTEEWDVLHTDMQLHDSNGRPVENPMSTVNAS